MPGKGTVGPVWDRSLEEEAFELTLKHGRCFFCGEGSCDLCDGCGGRRRWLPGHRLSEQAQPWLAEGVQVAQVISQGGLPKSGLAGIQSLEGGGC